MTWQTISASETDADSPLSQTLFDKIRGNLDFLKARWMVLSDPPTQLTTTWNTSWTDLTISSGSDTPEFAIIELRVQLGQETMSGNYARVEVRKKDDTGWSYFPSAEARDFYNSGAWGKVHNMVFVPVDEDKKFQYRCTSNASTKSVEIIQIGYFTKE